jgi:hypothetical protein
MVFSLVRNFLDLFYTPLTQKACEDVPETEWVTLVFLDSKESGFGTVELVRDFLGSKFINSEFFQFSKFYCSEDYSFRDAYFTKDIPFWILYFKTSQSVLMPEVSSNIFTHLQGIKFHLPLHFRNDSEMSLEESRIEFIKMMQSHKETLANSSFLSVAEDCDQEEGSLNLVTIRVDVHLSP